MNNVPLVFIDTETTGLSYDKQVWEVATIRDNVDGTTERDMFQLEVHTTDTVLYEFSDRAKEVNHFEENYYPADFAITPTQAVNRLKHTFRDRAHFVGMVPDFDANALWRLIRDTTDDLRAGFPWYYQLIDVDIMAYGYYIRHVQDEPESEKYVDGLTSLPIDSDKLSALLCVAKPSDSERHTAMGDTVWTRNIYYALLGTKPPGN